MKSHTLTLFLLLQMAVIPSLFSQNVGINATGSLPDSSAILDVSSTNKGFLLPRMTTAQQNAIILPATGLAIFNTTLKSFQVNTGTSANPVWSTLSTSTSTSAWSVGGNNVASVQPIGTTSNFDFPFITNNTEKMRLSAGGNLGIGNSVADGANAEKLLADAGTNSYNVISGKGNLNNYLQLNIKNINSGTSASSDIVATNDAGTEVNGKNYVNMGINSSSNTSTGILGGANTGYLYSTGSEFAIGNAASGKNLLVFTGGVAATNERMRIDSSGNVGIGNTVPVQKLDVTGNVKFSGALMPGNSAGTAGNVLISEGTAAAPLWIALDTTNISGFSKKVRPLLTATAPITYSNANGVIGAAQATATQDGFLSSEDWNTFNNKQSPVTKGSGVTSFNKTDNYGITSSLINPTSTPVLTIGVDTITIASRSRLANDSSILGAAINSKQNQLNGTGFIKANGSAIIYDNSNYITGNQAITFTPTGDVTGSSTGSASLTPALTIGSNAVTNAKLATMAANSFKANLTGSTAAPTDISGTEATTLLNVFSAALKGLVPASSGGTTGFLRADGTFAVPPGTNAGTVTLFGKTDNYGITSSVTNQATTPVHTIGVDTIAISTRGWRQKGIDSVQSNVNTITTSLSGKQTQLNGTGFVKASGTSISYDNSTYLTSNQSITLSGDISGTGTSAVNATLPTVNSTVGTFNNITINAKGLATGGSNVTYLTSIDTTNIASFYTKIRSLSSATAPITYSNGVIAISQATTSSNGYLSNADWNTFNTKGSGAVTGVSVAAANGVSGTVTATTTPAITLTLGAITPVSVAATGTIAGSNLSGTNTGNVTIATANGLSVAGQALSLGLAGASTTGALTTADWNIFNNKQPAGSYLTSNQSITLSGDISGTGTSAVNATLPTVNSTVGTFNNITINAKGLATGGSNVTYLTSIDTTNIASFYTKIRSLSSATAPITYSNGVIAISQATTSSNGYLSNADWNTFNTKGSGAVTGVSVAAANGVSGTVTATTTPAITLTLGAITPVSVAATGTIAGSNLSGTNTGNVTIATANGLSVAGQALSLGLAGASTTGALSTADWNIFNNKGSGAVTSASVVTANGLAGSITSTSTPAITLSTTVNGLVKGNGTALSAATSGTDYAPGTAANTTGLVKSTTGTGALTTAVLADFPTFNQNTTGTASNITGTLNATSFPALTGDVTTTAGSVVTTIKDGVITNAKAANMITQTFKGRTTAGTGIPEDLTATQATAMLNTFGVGKGLVPPSSGGTTSFLRADGTFAIPPGTSTGTVTSASVVTANGLAGSVTSTATPAITLTTTVNGIVKGNGAALSAATAGTDYAPGTASNTTGFVKSTTGTGALTTALLADFPTFNQNTTGTASNITGTLNATSFPALTGDVTTTAGSLATTISAGAVANIELANMATQTFKGRTSTGTGIPEDLTATQATAMLNTFNTVKGLVPASSGGNNNFLRADGIFAVPPGTNTATGTVTSISVTTANGVSGSVITPTTTPSITLTLGAIKPLSVAATGTVGGSNLSGTNTGDETAATIKTKLGPATTNTDGYLTSDDWNTFNSALNNSIVTTVTDLTLNTTHHTVIITGNTNTGSAPKITLPSAAGSANRIYIIVNETGNNANLGGSYIGFNKGNSTIVSGTSAITIQSDGKDWYRIQ